MSAYRTFKRSATGWESFVRARKYHDMYWATIEEARARCERFNSNRNAGQVRRGTKMEFERV